MWDRIACRLDAGWAGSPVGKNWQDTHFYPVVHSRYTATEAETGTKTGIETEAGAEKLPRHRKPHLAYRELHILGHRQDGVKKLILKAIKPKLLLGCWGGRRGARCHQDLL